jgi:hypothetical protein
MGTHFSGAEVLGIISYTSITIKDVESEIIDV